MKAKLPEAIRYMEEARKADETYIPNLYNLARAYLFDPVTLPVRKSCCRDRIRSTLTRMTIHDVYLICFAAGSVIHGAQTVLAAKLGRHRTGAGRILAFDGLAMGRNILSAIWQFPGGRHIDRGAFWGNKRAVPCRQLHSRGLARLFSAPLQLHVVIVVEDRGLGHPSASRHRGTGIGLTNVRERLQHLYGIGGTLMLEEMTPGGTRAVLTLPQLVGVQS